MGTQQKKPHIIICGAGIGGLTVAHEIAKRGYKVIIYERNEQIGGLARSKYASIGLHNYPVEYSWRVYGTGYRNLLRILSEIPLRKSKNKSVHDNLVKARTYIFPRKGKRELIFSKEKNINNTNFDLGSIESFKILNKIFYCLTMSKSRMDSLDSLKWNDFCKDLSIESKKYIVKLWGPVLGMDPTYMSFPVVARFVGILLARYTGLANSVNLLNKPTNDGWFDEWSAYLEKTGNVVIHRQCEITKLSLNNGIIDKVTIHDHKNKKTIINTADFIICAMDVEAISKIVQQNKKLMADNNLNNITKLSNVCYQIQLSVQIFLNDEIEYPTLESPILYFPDSPWALIIEPQAKVWKLTYSTDPRVKSVLSVGICQTDKPGIVHKKPFTKCNKKEIRDEVTAQIQQSYKFSKIKMKKGGKFSNDNILVFYIWDSFSFNNKGGEINIWEPKFSNNAGSLPLMPNIIGGTKNLLFATGYTKTNRYIYSMESAAEAGINCANEIFRLSGDGKRIKTFKLIRSNVLLLPLTTIDHLLFTLKIPHLGKLVGNSVILLIIYILIFPISIILILILI